MLKAIFLSMVLVGYSFAAAAEDLPKIKKLDCVATNGVVIRTLSEASKENMLGGAIISARFGALVKNFEAILENGHNGTTLIVLHSDSATYAIAANLDLESVDAQRVEGNLLAPSRGDRYRFIARAHCEVKLK